jgi:arylsulfatase A-like enzyme
MIHVPWLPKSFGQRTSSLVELVDVFPTVAAIAGLPAPADVDGVDVSSLLQASPNGATSELEGKLETELQAAYH